MRIDIEDYAVPEAEVQRINRARAKASKRPEEITRRSVRSDEHFSKTFIWWLKDPSFYRSLPARSRVLHLLMYKTANGTKAAKFTSDDARDIAVTPNKMRILRQLEADGLIIVETRGTAIPIIRMAPKALHQKD